MNELILVFNALNSFNFSEPEKSQVPSKLGKLVKTIFSNNVLALGLEITLNDFLEDGNLDTFIRCLTDVVKVRIKTSGRGAISKLAKDLGIDRSNLSEIVNGYKQPHLEMAFKLLNGLGFKYDIKLKSA